ncbi:MAG: biopolymer transporter ExbD [Deltaproteobacteria bacterium]|nr:biopolymer transporter ExbD [Deltaproteobacteria bacterium]
MNFSGKQNADDGIAIDITPLVDVCFSLVLFFMVTTTFISAQALDVSLPKAKTGGEIEANKELIVSTDAANNIIADKHKLNIAELKSLLLSWKEKQADFSLVIWGDKGTNHGTIVTILDTAKELGITNIAIATEAQR